jgi:hypothetical protein
MQGLRKADGDFPLDFFLNQIQRILSVYRISPAQRLRNIQQLIDLFDIFYLKRLALHAIYKRYQLQMTRKALNPATNRGGLAVAGSPIFS